MNSDTASATLLGPLAIVLVCLGLLWAVAVPHTVSRLTYLLLAGAAGTVITVAAMTYRNGQAPATMTQICTQRARKGQRAVVLDRVFHDDQRMLLLRMALPRMLTVRVINDQIVP
jgi:hypothetical protein